MQIDKNIGLILEGGGMRGVFTSGVLDAFMKHDLYFNYVVAVSAGACNGMSYISKQPRRARMLNIDYLEKYKYIGIRHLVTQGCIFDQELLYDKFQNEVLPFDFNTYFQNPVTFEVVTTNCETGKAEYIAKQHDKQHAMDVVRASSSLPYVSKIAHVDGVPMLDGGIVDSIPIIHAMETGHKRNVVIMTRNFGFRSREKDRKIPRFVYKSYPRLRVVLSHRVEVYNKQLQLMEDLEQSGEVMCIRPKRQMEVGRIEKDTVKLEALYEEGFALGNEFCRKLNDQKSTTLGREFQMEFMG